jgi:FlaA1/EpsC-like NDP-sugar epimerase
MSTIESPYDPVMQQDIERLVGHFDFSPLYHSTVLISGATGLIGSQLVKVLSCLNRIKQADITICALIRDTQKAQNVFQELYGYEKIHFVVHDIRQKPELNDDIDYMYTSITPHLFFLTGRGYTFRK